jgi:hypothetical protein
MRGVYLPLNWIGSKSTVNSGTRNILNYFKQSIGVCKSHGNITNNNKNN